MMVVLASCDWQQHQWNYMTKRVVLYIGSVILTLWLSAAIDNAMASYDDDVSAISVK